MAKLSPEAIGPGSPPIRRQEAGEEAAAS